MSPLSEQLRNHIAESRLSLYRISKLAKVTERTVTQFVRKDIDLKIFTIEKIAAGLKLDIEVRPKQGAKLPRPEDFQTHRKPDRAYYRNTYDEREGKR